MKKLNFCFYAVLAITVTINEYPRNIYQNSTFTPEATTDKISKNWYSSVQNELMQKEYHISQDLRTKSYQSPNRKQNIRSRYTPGEWNFQNRDTTVISWKGCLRTIGVFADNEKIAEPEKQAETVCREQLLEYHHDGFTEQYLNTEEGIRQNFIVFKAPKGTRRLSVALQLEGFKSEKISDTALKFKNSIQTLTYSGLKAWDAEGKILPASIELGEEGFALCVNTEDAAYPVTIDPIVANGNPSNANRVMESNQASATMGFSVSGAGDVNGDGYSDVIIGAYQYDNGQTDEGVAFIYHGSSTGPGAAAATTIESNQASAYLGSSVSTAGDVNRDGYSDIIVGSRQYDNGQTDEGVAFVYHGSATGISTTASATIESNQASAYLGYSVSDAGDVNGDGFSDVIVGAKQYDNGETDEGGAFLYHGSATGINTTAVTMIQSNQASAYLGSSVSSAGDVNGDGYSDIIVGAYNYDNGQTDEGRAFVYHGSSTGINTTIATTMESNQASAYLGYSVSGAGDVNGDGYSDVIVGAYSFDNGQTDEGAAFVYHGSITGVSATAAVTLESNQASANMGISVSGAGDVNGNGYSDVIVGVYLYDNSETDEGAAFVYHGAATGINATSVSIIESNLASANLGISVSGAGDVNGDGYSDVIAGAYNYDNGQTDEGAAFVYHGSASTVGTTSSTLLERNQANAQMGFSVSSAGDVNGDGYSDVIVGAWLYDNGQTDEGAAFLYHGSSAGLNTTVAATLESNQASAFMGYSVSSAGDVNGDGYSDVLVSAYLYDNGQTDEGIAYIYHGSAAGISTTPVTTLEANQASANYGTCVASAGDVNGDGYSDVVVGSGLYDNGQTDEGMIFVYHGGASGVNTVAVITLECNQVNAQMGRASGAGDVNGDGYDDLVVGARYYDNGETDEGVAFVYHGSVTGISSTVYVTLEINQANAWFARIVLPAGDVNGDGYSDIIIGAQYYDNGQTDEGGAFIYHGSASGITPGVATTLESNQASSLFGYSVSGAGDVNGDGYSDVIVGAYQYDNGLTDEGVSFVYHGSTTGISATAAIMLESNQAGANLGCSVSGAGDVNGDGYSDVVIGALKYDNGQTDEGTCFIYQGNAGGGLRRTPQLYNTGTTNPISQFNIGSSQFDAGMYAKNPEGRTKGKLVWEVKKEGQAFTSVSVITNSTLYTGRQAAFTNLGTSGVLIQNSITKPGFQTKVRVRVQYDPVTSQNGEVYGPWIYPQFYFGTQGMNATPLPVTLLNFTATPEDHKVLLQWQTSNESSNSHFEIERSKDGTVWEFVSIKEGAGNSSSVISYTSADEAPYTGDSYYRLKQVDQNGNSFYSEIVLVNREGAFATMNIYPNPSSDKITIEFSGEKIESFKIYNLVGEEMNSYVNVISYEDYRIIAQIELLPSGVYTVKASGFTGRICKQ